MTFYDYDYVVKSEDDHGYWLRANMKRLPVGYCRIMRHGTGWMRKTCWHAKGGTRYFYFRDLDLALASGIAWARRREREDQKESSQAS